VVSVHTGLVIINMVLPSMANKPTGAAGSNGSDRERNDGPSSLSMASCPPIGWVVE
jgi:hypothetical protein